LTQPKIDTRQAVVLAAVFLVDVKDRLAESHGIGCAQVRNIVRGTARLFQPKNKHRQPLWVPAIDEYRMSNPDELTHEWIEALHDLHDVLAVHPAGSPPAIFAAAVAMASAPTAVRQSAWQALDRAGLIPFRDHHRL
jgi:hypothetical protein